MRFPHKTFLPYIVILSAVMSIYSIFLVHLTRSFQSGLVPEPYPGGPDRRSHPAVESRAEALHCQCTSESVAGLEGRREVAIGLSLPYKYFNSNHWFHISEYYVSRHTHVAPKLPRNATVYIVAPHDLFVPNLLPMTFFLLLLAFTDGTARTAEVLPWRASAQLAVVGQVLKLDNNGVESYVYDSSLPAFHRTRRYQPGERQAAPPSRGLTALLESREEREEGARIDTPEAVAAAFADAATAVPMADCGFDADVDGGGGGGRGERHRRRQLPQRDPPGGFNAVKMSAASSHHLRAPGGNDERGGSEHARQNSWSSGSMERCAGGAGGGGSDRESWGRKGVGRDAADVASVRVQSDGDGDGVGGDGVRQRQPLEGGIRREPGLTAFPEMTESFSAMSTAGQQHGSRWMADEGAASGSRDGGSLRHSRRPEEANAAALTARELASRSDDKRGAQADEGPTPPPVEAGEIAAADRNERLGNAGTELEEVEAQSHPRDDRHEDYFDSTPEEAMEEAEFFPLSTLTGQRQQLSTRPCACARYIGEFGAAPVERGYWFREEKVENTRARIDALCGDIYRRRREGQPPMELGTEDSGDKGGSSRQRLVIYQRNRDRRLLKLNDNMDVFRKLLGPKWDVVQIVHDNAHEPCWLYSQLMDADMLLTPHGFQSMLLLFLPPGATILEVFPYKYWKEGYAPLAKEWGVRHEHIMSRPVTWAKRLVLFFVPLEGCMKSIHCRKWSRGADVRLEEHHLRQIVKAANHASKRKQDFLPALSLSGPESNIGGVR